MKKISLIITSLVFCIAAVFVFPAKEANANPLAVGGALYLGGAGVYVVGAVAVAGIAGIAGCESCQEDIEAHAARTWDGSTQLVKDGIQLMVDASVGAWGATSSALTATDASVNSWMDAQINGFAETIANSKVPDAVASNNYTLQKGAYNISFTMTGALDFAWGVNNSFDSRSVRFEISGGDLKKVTSTGSISVPSGLSYIELDKLLQAVGTPFQMATLWNSYVVNSTNPTYDLSVVVNSVAWNETYNQAVSSTSEAWEDMKDAGLVLPVDIARPMAGNVPLTYNPTTDTYAGIDGITVPHDDVTGFEFPKPNWKTVEDLTALGLSGAGAGLYIDGWAGSDSVTSTYDPVADITTTVTSTGTTTSVTTGATSITGSTTTTTTGDTTGNPPVNPPTVNKPGDPLNPFKAKPMPIAALTGLFQLLAALIFYLIRLFTFIATLALIAPTPIDNPYFIWFTTATFQGITPYPLVQNLALFFLGFSVYRSVRRVFG